MPLCEFLECCNVFYVNVPMSILTLEVTNSAEYCRYALQNYFRSKKFLEDIEKILESLDDYVEHGFSDFSLFFKREINLGDFTLALVNQTPDGIDSF